MDSSKFSSTISEKINAVLGTTRKSISTFNDTLGNALQYIDAIPLHESDYDDQINEVLPALEGELSYIEKQTFDNFTEALFANTTNNRLLLSVANGAEAAIALNCQLVDGVLSINNSIINVATYTSQETGNVYYEVDKALSYIDAQGDSQRMYLDDAIHSLMASDEINRINEKFIEAISKGEADLDVILNRVKIEFTDSMIETKNYLSQIAQTLSLGPMGFLNLLKSMYTKISTSLGLITNTNVLQFTDNDQYVVKDFTSGVISTFSNVISDAWERTRDIFVVAAAIVSTVVKIGYNLVVKAANKALDQYTTSQFNLSVNNTNYPVGVIQYTIETSDFPDTDVGKPNFLDLYDYIYSLGPQKIIVPWGSIYLWLNDNKIYVEHKLRTDITNVLLRGDFKMCDNTSVLSSTAYVPRCNSGPTFIFNHTSGSYGQYPSIGKQGVLISDLSIFNNVTPGQFYNELVNGMTISPITDQSIPDSELSMSSRIENAFVVLMNCMLYFEVRNFTGTGYVNITCEPTDNLFSTIESSYPEYYKMTYLAYSISWYLCRRVNYFLLTDVFPVSENDAWIYLNTSRNLNSYKGSSHYVFSYYPLSLFNVSNFISATKLNKSKTIDYQKNCSYIYGISKQISDIPAGSSIVPDVFYKESSQNASDKGQFFLGHLIASFICSNRYSVYFGRISAGRETNLYELDYVGDNGDFIIPPSYTKKDLVSGMLLIAGVITGIMLIITIPTMIIKRKLAINSALRSARVESAWSDAVKQPTKENIVRYRKLVKTNNIRSRMFGGNIFNNTGFWTTEDQTNLLSQVSNSIISNKSIKNTSTDVDDVNLTKLIRGY